MSYKLKVIEDEDEIVDLDNDKYQFFENFMSECGYMDPENVHHIDYYLAPYKARNVFAEPYIEFATEEDAIWFLLKWS